MGGQLSSTVRTQSIESVYTFKEKLGQGTFAVVKRATHNVKGEDFAVKVIDKKNLSADELSTLHDEIEILQMISHRHIVKLCDLYETSTTLYMVMELLSGGELFESIVNKVSYSEKEAASITKQIASAIVYLNTHGIVHRDLKPENLIYQENPLTNPDASVKITDLRLAKFLGNEENTSTMRTACGTPGYVAPEILKNESYSEAVDMWSLGVILFILLCGYPPFSKETAAGLYAQIRSGGYAFQSPYWDDISEDAKNLVGQLLTVQPSKRIRPTKVLSHYWIRKNEFSNRRPFSKIYITKMKAFNAKRKLKKGNATIVATSRFMGMFRAMAAATKAPARSNIGDVIRLRVKVWGSKEELEIKANDAWNVAGLKLEIAERRHCNPHSFDVSFKGSVMERNLTLASFHGLKDGVTITLTNSNGKPSARSSI